MPWRVLDHPEFNRERARLPQDVSDKLDELSIVLRQEGPVLGRPLVDTLAGSRHANMKELRFSLRGPWRFAFAFDEDRQAIILVGGNKQGSSEARFYRTLVRVADDRFDDWLSADRRDRR